ncbi:MAG TPA: hypothetical protein VML55_06100, partial [Planctomycetaceae bacterium]|nr:hypothetical protein [Planctomycetaceae bacterium]
MTTAAHDSQGETDPAPPAPAAGVPPPADRRVPWWRAPRVFAGYSAVLAAVFLLFGWLMPITPTDSWGHLAYGRILWERGVFPLPATEPLMPLAEGVPFVDTAWLSQLSGYAAYRGAGLAALRFLYAAGVTACVGLLLWRMYSRVRNWWLPLAGAALFLWVDWIQLEVFRPQLAGLVCFLALWFVLTARRWSRANWIVVPAIFALWANLHGSFPVGLAVLACFLVGRAVDVERHSRQIGWIVFDRQVQRYFFLLELAAAAALLNPYGPGLYAEVFSFAAHPNLGDLSEWRPLTLEMTQGTVAGITALVLVFLYRLTPRRISAIEVLVLVVLGFVAMRTSRFVVWWAPVAAYYAVLH